ncbi:hypothetical protein [Phormidium sp. CCY1219]|uniref:hypothetical protein n=1 Tax=Phormidium sp. CCY1219 TaxID=2886104 RepID=UPI002D1E735F|nr:hypothetical protein [Phormidium sp. CCY1219]MEB3826397.1 hypothetical protein [Phormidium sp. CCY1219]
MKLLPIERETMTERIESVKAGAIASLSFLLIFVITALLNETIIAPQFANSAPLFSSQPLLFTTASAGFMGFLFGVTYRYIIRADNNVHLKSGAVLAFGLVRALAKIEIELSLEGRNLAIWESILPASAIAIESILGFAVAGVILDAAIARNWVKPFDSES